METQVKALTILLSALRGRFVCGNSAFSQQISTFYGPTVQTMETRLGARQRRRPPTVHRDSTHAPRLQRPVASQDEASACSELRLGCHPETPVIEPCPDSCFRLPRADEKVVSCLFLSAAARRGRPGSRPFCECQAEGSRWPSNGRSRTSRSEDVLPRSRAPGSMRGESPRRPFPRS